MGRGDTKKQPPPPMRTTNVSISATIKAPRHSSISKSSPSSKDLLGVKEDLKHNPSKEESSDESRCRYRRPQKLNIIGSRSKLSDSSCGDDHGRPTMVSRDNVQQQQVVSHNHQRSMPPPTSRPIPTPSSFRKKEKKDHIHIHQMT